MERNEGGWRVRNQYRVPFDVHKDLTGNDVLGVAVSIFERLQGIHFLELFLFGSNRDFTSVESNLQFTLLIQIELMLVFFARFKFVNLHFLFVCF